ncbi:MAG: hypothetical protein R8F63_08045 [Acidimicrobiales bacterium]|nr:hypothetical protein [Acidimicrobiales bacterium]
MLHSLNRSAVLVGAAWCLAIAVPAAIVTAVLADDDAGTNQSNWVLVALLAIVVAYLLGGAQAGRRVPDVAFLNGAAATLLAFAVVQTIGIVRRLIADEGISWSGLVFNALLAPSIGIVGAWFGARRALRDSAES